jgi:hypothetical protein
MSNLRVPRSWASEAVVHGPRAVSRSRSGPGRLKQIFGLPALSLVPMRPTDAKVWLEPEPIIPNAMASIRASLGIAYALSRNAGT